jgi:hypothetical protein
MVLVAWATLVGPRQVFTGPGIMERTAATPTESCVPLEVVSTAPDGTTTTTERPENPRHLPWCDEPSGDAAEPTSRGAGEPPVWLKVLTWTFVAAIAGTILGLLVFLGLVLHGRRGPRRRRDQREQVAFGVLDEPTRLVEEMTGDAEAQDAVLRAGDPRNAIVAAWQRFEVQGEAAGVGRHPWETSSEYAIRILDLVSADTGAVNRLATLYREARFSEHPIAEDHRAVALEALATIRRSLGARV